MNQLIAQEHEQCLALLRMLDRPQTRHFRTLFISDVHLGSRGCQAGLLLDFMRFHDAEQIFLVGDIVDGWRLRRGWYWPQEHNDVVQKLLRKARKGCKIIYIPGNHDEFLRDYLGSHFGGVDVVDRAIHETADGKRLLVIHGDQFDVVVKHSRWLAHIGDTAYTTVLALNTVFNRIRRRLGFDYWSLSAYLKFKVKNAVNYMGAFEEALAGAARREGADGVVCGHIHHARIVDMAGFKYINTGDWVESCTAVVEHHDGALEIIPWPKIMAESNDAGDDGGSVPPIFQEAAE